ncbi:MAG: hypothetical protein JNN30_20800 [Rhodanobacteraceae bacterium]|nr:hypothetical protein [Rhodanobacteraceae bacterium]
MSFREKSAWIYLLSLAAVAGIYFLSISPLAPELLRRFDLLDYLVLLIGLQAGAILPLAIFARRETVPAVESDACIELKATRLAYAVLATSVAFACFFGAMKPALHFSGNTFVFFLVSAEILRSGSRIALLRRSTV